MGKTITIFALLFSVCIMGCDSNMENSIDENTNNDIPIETEDISIDSSDESIDIITRYNLPTLSRMSEEDQEQYVNDLQVMKKMDVLNLKEEDFIYPEQNMKEVDSLLNEKKKSFEENFSEIVTFDGSTSNELQKFINHNANKTIVIESKEVEFTSCIKIPSNVCIEGQNVKITSSSNIDYAFLIDGVKNVSLSGIQIDGGFQYGVYVIDCENIKVTNTDINNLGQKPIAVVGECEYIMVNDNTFIGNQSGGIYFDGNINYGEISKNTVINNHGTSNWMAGIVLCDVELQDKNDLWEMFRENHHFPLKDTTYSETNCPHNIIVSDNYVENNNSSGIYSDGAYLCYFTSNIVRNNDKEGICLDYSTLGCYLYGNTFEGNGGRMNQTDEDSEGMDFAGDYENIICRNTISGNHYSGVFIGECGYVNDVFDNVIMQPKMFSVEAISPMFNSIVNNISDKDIRNEYVSE